MRATAILLLGVTWSLVAALANCAREKEHGVTNSSCLDLLMAKFEQMEREMLAVKEEITQLKLAIKKGLVAEPSLSALFTLTGAYYPTNCNDLILNFKAYSSPMPYGYYMVQTNASEASRKFVLCNGN